MVWVVFVDTDARRYCDEDIICYTLAEAKEHMRDLKDMGFDKPVFKTYANEEEYYDIKETK